jgi:hypothetical protein
MGDERWVKKLLEGTRRRENKGRPRLRWMKDVELDLRNLSVKKWITGAWGRTGICRQ